MATTAVTILESYGNPSLQQMARQRGLDIKGKGKFALIQLVAPTLFDPERIRAALADLEPIERLLLDRLLLAGGDASSDWLRNALEREGRLPPQDKKANSFGYRRGIGSPWNRGSDRFEDVVARLGVLGLAFTAGPRTGGSIVDLSTPGWRLVVPAEIRAHLPGVSLAVKSCVAPPVVLASNPGALLRDAYTLLASAERASIPLTTRGQIMKRALVQIDESLVVSERAASARSEDDLDRLPFLRALLEECALLVLRPGELVVGEGVEGFLSQPAGDRLRLLYESFCQTARWCELFRIAGLKVTTRGGGRGALPPVIKARGRVIAELAELPSGEWIPVQHVVERIRQRSYDFLFSRRHVSRDHSYYYGQSWGLPYGGDNPMGWSFEDANNRTFGRIMDDDDGWNLVEAGLIRVIVTRALYWLGAVDLGGASGEELTAFRITPEGARLLRGQSPVFAPAEPHVVVQPNFQVFAFPPTGEDVLFKLDRMAERVRAEQVVEYRLTRESAYRAQQGGFSASAMITFLEEVSKTPLPQNVRRTLEEWDAQHERIVVRRGSAVLQTADEPILDALYADPAIAPFLGRRLAPTVALVSSTNLKPLYDRMLCSDRLLALDEGLDELSQPVLSVDASGHITFRQRVPSIHLLRTLRSFADGASDDTLGLSAASLRSAARQGMDAESIISALEKWHVGPLPAEVAAMVRRWAKDWGRGALVSAALLQVQSPEILSALLADPHIGPHLHPVPGSNTLAIVRDEAVEQVRSALQALGMPLSDELMLSWS
ncbi:MAG: hypothetical protein EPO21_06000 [Chloroflexota bacterium]|nr:MAG: hypothetical protein EPO21_06000 [Chloroflexota bacterium]